LSLIGDAVLTSGDWAVKVDLRQHILAEIKCAAVELLPSSFASTSALPAVIFSTAV